MQSRRLALALAALVLLGAGLGWTDASAPDEPRYLQVAEELRAGTHGVQGLVLLHLNGEPYTQKPPLYYAVAAAFGAPFGRVGEVAARLPSALAGMLLVLLTFGLGSRLLGARSALLGAAMLLTVYEFGHLARRIQLDVVLALFETLALAAFWATERHKLSRAAGAALFHGAMGLAVLTKGPVGVLVPGLIVAATLASERRARDLRTHFPWWGWLLSIAPGVAWITAATALAPAGFANEAVGTNLIGRFFSGTSHDRPFYYYLYTFPVDFLPWTLVFPAVWWAARRRVFAPGSAGADARRSWRFLLLWVGVSIAFFSISSGKRGLYLVPAFPAAALLCADACLRWVDDRGRVPRALSVAASVAAWLLALLGVVALLLALGLPGLPASRALTDARQWAASLEGKLLAGFGVAVLAALATGWLAWRSEWASARPDRRLWVSVAVAFVIEAAIFGLLRPALDPITSPRPIAQAAAALTPPGGSIGLVGDRAMVGGLAYYGGRRVEPLEEPEDVPAFLERGGAVLVFKARKLDRIRAVVDVEVVATLRSGGRAVIVATPRRVAPARPGSDGRTAGPRG